MARRLRIQYENALYHVINRGNYRSDVFSSAGAARAFQAAMGEACERYRWRVHAYVIMRNHYHLALETPQPNLVEGMHWLQSTFATRFNRFRSENGHLFQGRYQALLVEDDHALSRVIDYVHLNPVRAKIVPAHLLPSFEPSSLPAFIKGPRPAWLVGDALCRAHNVDDTREGWHRYGEYLAAFAGNSVGLTHPRFEGLTRGWAIGSLGWKRAIAREHARLALFPGLPAQENRDLREAGWRAKLEMILSELGKTPVDLNRAPPLAAWKIQIALRLRVGDAAPYRWLTRELHMGTTGALRVRLWREVRM